MNGAPSGDANAQLALLEQLADAAQRSADGLARLDATVQGLHARLGQLEQEARERRQADLQRHEALERLLADIERRIDDARPAQLEALAAQQQRQAEQLENLATEFRRAERLQAGLAQLSRELQAELTSREQALRHELQGQIRQRQEETERLGRSLQGFLARDEALAALDKALESQGRQLADLQRQSQGQALAHDTLQAGLVQRDEALRQVEQRLRAGQMEQRAELQALGEAIAQWQEKAEAQQETLRQARGLVDEGRAAAERLRLEHQASRQEIRVAGERTDHALAALRQENAQRWELLAAERRRDWTGLAQDRAAERQALGDELKALREAVEAELALMSAGLAAGLDLARADLDSMRHRLGLAMRGLREAFAETAESFAVDLPSGDPSGQAPERRQALRRALRARRHAGGGGP